jgi:hypothetical protein
MNVVLVRTNMFFSRRNKALLSVQTCIICPVGQYQRVLVHLLRGKALILEFYVRWPGMIDVG